MLYVVILYVVIYSNNCCASLLCFPRHETAAEAFRLRCFNQDRQKELPNAHMFLERLFCFQMSEPFMSPAGASLFSKYRPCFVCSKLWTCDKEQCNNCNCLC